MWFIHINKSAQAGKLTQWLRVFAALSETKFGSQHPHQAAQLCGFHFQEISCPLLVCGHSHICGTHSHKLKKKDLEKEKCSVMNRGRGQPYQDPVTISCCYSRSCEFSHFARVTFSGLDYGGLVGRCPYCRVTTAVFIGRYPCPLASYCPPGS